MNAPDDDPAPDPAVESAAAEWLVRHDRGLTPPQQDAFLQWLAASPAHRESFARHRRMWTDFNALAQWQPEHSTVPNPDLLARPRRSRVLRWSAPGLLAAAAAVVIALWRAPDTPSPTTAPLAFEAAGYRQETLPDGTVLDLNRGAHVVVQFSPAERRVLLVQGEAQFAVAKNPARPFVVRAGGVDVRAVGTAFNVKLAGEKIEVLVTEGTVRVSQQTIVENHPPAPRATELLATLTAGQRTVMPVALAIPPPPVISVSPLEIEQLLHWRPRLLDFDSTPLADVVATFNRRNATQLVIADATIRDLPIVASIRSDNVEGFVRLAEATMGVRADRQTAGVIRLHRAH